MNSGERPTFILPPQEFIVLSASRWYNIFVKQKPIAGFGLIELVIVIVILGILSAIALPRFINFRTEAMIAACRGNVGIIRNALATYYAVQAIQGNPHFPSDSGTTRAEFAEGYFAAETIPVCQITNQAYTWNSLNGVIQNHSH
jgi:prepilin-type N-terminal cleavage/methylation domain-containing protein